MRIQRQREQKDRSWRPDQTSDVPALLVSQPGDRYEREAETVSDEIITDSGSDRRINPISSAAPSRPIQQQPQHHPETTQDSNVDAPEAVYEALRSPGIPLEPKIREELEPRFGHHFGDVRIHADPRSRKSARTLDAAAYTVGNDIVGNHSMQRAQTIQEQHLLAHELTHVAQQRDQPEARSIGEGGAPPLLVQRQETLFDPPKVYESASGTRASPRELPRLQEERNPTYDEAQTYIERYVDRQRLLDMMLVSMKDAAFRIFSERTSKEYNQSSSIALELFEIALSVIPGAKVLHASLKRLSEGSKALSAAVGVSKKVGTAATKQGAATAGRAMGDFKIEVIRSLSDLQLSLEITRGMERDALHASLERFRQVHEGIDLLNEIQQFLGEIPSLDGVQEAMQLARERFELQLYRDYYVISGRWDGTRSIYRWSGGTVEERYDGGPEGLPSGLVDWLDQQPERWMVLTAGRPIPEQVIIDQTLEGKVEALKSWLTGSEQETK